MRKLMDFGVDFKETTLINGVKLYSFYKPNSPIYFRTFFHAGSQFDGDKSGLAHFCEHIVASGTEKFPTKDLINEKVQEIGGRKNAFTSFNNLWLTLDLADKADLPDMLDVLDQMLNHSLFTQEGIDIERKVILAEQTRSISNPEQNTNNLAYSLIFQKTDIENPVLGSDESVKKISRQDLLDYKDKYLNNGQVAYFISGDFDEGVVVDCLNRINGSRMSIKLPSSQLPIIEIKKENIKTVPGAEQNYLSCATRLNPIIEKNDMVAAIVFNAIFGQTNTSRLHQALRSKKGLVYGVYSSLSSRPEFASFLVKTNCKVKDTLEVIDIIKVEFSRIIQKGIDEDELTRAKKSILRNIKFNSESASFFVVMSLMIELTNYNDPILPDEYVEIVKSLTVEDVNLFIKEYLAGRELLLAGVGDFSFLKK